MTSPTVPPPDLTAPPRGSERFFLWIAGLGIARSDGWLGGVCAGVAARLRIDPLIVRGVVVVASLFGLPLLFVYAAAWALLPDADGTVHLRALLRGRYAPAQLGIAALVLLSFVPARAPLSMLTWVFFGSTVFYDGVGTGPRTPFGALLWAVGLAVAAVLVVLIVRAALRGGRMPAAGAGASAADENVASFAAPVPAVRGDAPGATSEATAAHDAGQADGPAAASTVDSLDDWRTGQDAWRERDRDWRRSQQDADRAARDQARRERQEVAARFAAEASENRRLQRAANPRAGLAYLAAVIGLALIAGAVAGLVSASGEVAAAVGLLVAAVVLAAGMVVAGILRRRSGFLAFLTAAALAAGLVTGGAQVALREGIVLGSESVTGSATAQSLTQPFGTLWIDPVDVDPSARATSTVHAPIHVRKGRGMTLIQVSPGVEVDLDATLGDVRVEWTRQTLDTDGAPAESTSGTWTGTPAADGTRHLRRTVSSPLTPGGKTVIVQPVVLTQHTGIVQISILEPAPTTKESR